MNPVETAIRAEFEPLVAALYGDFKSHMTRHSERLLAAYGNKVSQLYNAWGQDGAIFREFGKYTIARPVDNYSQPIRGSDYAVQHAEIERLARRAASEAFEAMVWKLCAKLGDVEAVKLVRCSSGNGTFTLTCKRGDDKIVIEQDRIINCSSKGKLFHQWPARITVNGKKVSEAAFKKMNQSTAEV